MKPLPDGDVLIHAGDCTSRGTQFELEYFLSWFSAQSHKKKILIAGNHDWIFEKQPKLARKLAKDAGVIYLNDQSKKIGGFKFWGSPVQPEFNSWAFNRKRGSDIDKHWNLIPADTDVLITHGPPFNILDSTSMTKGPVGCERLRMHVNERIKPQIHIFGHIHSAHGLTLLHNTIFANVSQLTDYYELRDDYKPIVLDLERK